MWKLKDLLNQDLIELFFLTPDWLNFCGSFSQNQDWNHLNESINPSFS